MTSGILPVAVALAAAFVYGAALRRLNAHWPRWRTAAFGVGLLVVAAAVLPPLGPQAEQLFSLNVVQQLLLSLVASILVCLGSPVTLLLRAEQSTGGSRIHRLVAGRAMRTVTHPLVTWLLFSGTVFVLYFSGLFEVGLRNEWVHQLIQLQLLITGVLFFAPVVSADSHPWPMTHGVRLLYVLLTLPVHAFSALALMSATAALAADWYTVSLGRDAAEVLRDQKVGAAIRWAVGDLVALGAIGVIVGQWVKEDERNAQREDEVLAGQ